MEIMGLLFMEVASTKRHLKTPETPLGVINESIKGRSDNDLFEGQVKPFTKKGRLSEEWGGVPP
jgi:hypothetical protein